MKQKQAIRLEYLERLNVVTEYIDHNLDNSLSITRLTKISNFSPFHFHRIFKGFLGEPIEDFVEILPLWTKVTELLSQVGKTKDIQYLNLASEILVDLSNREKIAMGKLSGI